MRRYAAFLVAALSVGPGSNAAFAADASFEQLLKKAEEIYDLKQVLRPFVASCEREKRYFRRLFCEALNERLKAQHQSKLYLYSVEATEAGPLSVAYREAPEPAFEITVHGCLTCDGPLLEREGGDVSKGRFFVFQLPATLKIQRDRKRGSVYDFGDIGVGNYRVPLPKGTSEKKFRKQVLPHLRLDLLFRPVAGVERVGGRFKYAFSTFELVGHRVVHKCNGRVYAAAPPMKGKRIKVDKNDPTCLANQPKKLVKKPKLPAKLPRAKIKTLMDAVAADLHTCYSQFGVAGEVATDVVVSPDGKPRKVQVVGKLAGTPTARCVERLVANVEFPRFRGRSARLQWPFKIRE